MLSDALRYGAEKTDSIRVCLITMAAELMESIRHPKEAGPSCGSPAHGERVLKIIIHNLAQLRAKSASDTLRYVVVTHDQRNSVITGLAFVAFASSA
jgi:hypothetical protein